MVVWRATRQKVKVQRTIFDDDENENESRDVCTYVWQAIYRRNEFVEKERIHKVRAFCDHCVTCTFGHMLHRRVHRICTLWSKYVTLHKRWPISIIFGKWYLQHNVFSDLLISATYCCYIYIGETFINCTVITSAIKVAHYRCTNWTNIQFIHTTSLHLSLNITENVQNGFIAIHTGLKSLKPFINIVVQNAFRQAILTVNQALHRICHVSNWRLIQTVLHYVPYSTVNWRKIIIAILMGPKSGGINFGVSLDAHGVWKT